ncbi:MMPL family transporter [Streptomyces olivoreticuli]|uniref:MMPL family transporter n=1 Tax=Streptomyces olivoreticuli TaxID=68246 RepID=UPI00265879B3|nr:MMPL family transporter [Streptomyces olivoreticuli]WKK23936.1 MMPL family transporter [Streptomyces olivoreticuli]
MSEPNAAPSAEGWLGCLGTWCARHFVTVLVVWLAALGGLQGLDKTFGGAFSDNFSLPGTQSVQGLDVLKAHDPQTGGTSSPVVLHDATQPLAGVSGPVSSTVVALRKLPHVLAAANPLLAPAAGTQVAGPVSGDGRTAYITVRFDTSPQLLGQEYLQGVDRAVAPLRAAAVEVEYGGPLGELAQPQPDDRFSEFIGFAAAVVVLLAGFGSVLAALVPLVAALVGVLAGLAWLGLLAAAFTFSTVSPTLATMIGLGVGIDYALFLLTRHRQNVMGGMDVAVSAGRAVATSGRAVLVSGCTVVVALAGLWACGISFVGKLGTAAALTAITAVLAALTLVPALLGLAGRRIDRYRVCTPVAETSPRTGLAGGKERMGWHRYAGRVARHPWWFLAGGIAAVGLLAVPLFSMRLGHIGDGANPTSFTDRRAFDLMSAAFGPGSNGPLTVVVDGTPVPPGDWPTLVRQTDGALNDLPGAAGVSPLQTTPDGDVLTATVIPAGSPQDPSTTDLVNRLRNTVLPRAVAGTTAHPYVTGFTAVQVDFARLLADRLPLIITVVVALAFLIILTVFHGLLVALKAAALNVISIGASYGVVVAVFQWGWGGPALGVHGTVPIESFVPMMMFAIVFGLSMDYEIFLLSRVHEAWLRTGDSHGSVAHALEITARVITCAALIMTSVFAAFLISPSVIVKMLGLGLAVSVLIDATIVRLVLVPATMTLLGKSNWWAPHWLDKILPRIDTEGPTRPTGTGPGPDQRSRPER